MWIFILIFVCVIFCFGMHIWLNFPVKPKEDKVYVVEDIAIKFDCGDLGTFDCTFKAGDDLENGRVVNGLKYLQDFVENWSVVGWKSFVQQDGDNKTKGLLVPYKALLKAEVVYTQRKLVNPFNRRFSTGRPL